MCMAGCHKHQNIHIFAIVIKTMYRTSAHVTLYNLSVEVPVTTFLLRSP